MINTEKNSHINNIKSNSTEQKNNNLINSQPIINIGNFDNLDNLEFPNIT